MPSLQAIPGAGLDAKTDPEQEQEQEAGSSKWGNPSERCYVRTRLMHGASTTLSRCLGQKIGTHRLGDPDQSPRLGSGPVESDGAVSCVKTGRV